MDIDAKVPWAGFTSSTVLSVYAVMLVAGVQSILFVVHKPWGRRSLSGALDDPKAAHAEPTLQEAGGSYLVKTPALGIYRAVIFIHVVIIAALQLVYDGAFCTKFYTAWNWYLLGLYFLCATIASVRLQRQEQRQHSDSPASSLLAAAAPAGRKPLFDRRLSTACTVLFHINVTTVAIVDFTTWMVLFPMLIKNATPEHAAFYRKAFLNFISYNQHGYNVAFMFVDLLLGGQAFFPWMVGAAGCWSLVYACWAHAYHAWRGRWLYPFLDTSLPSAPFAYGLLYGSHWIFFSFVYILFIVRDRVLRGQIQRSVRTAGKQLAMQANGDVLSSLRSKGVRTAGYAGEEEVLILQSILPRQRKQVLQ